MFVGFGPQQWSVNVVQAIIQGLVGIWVIVCDAPPRQWHLGEWEAQGLAALTQIGILFKLHLMLWVKNSSGSFCCKQWKHRQVTCVHSESIFSDYVLYSIHSQAREFFGFR